MQRTVIVINRFRRSRSVDNSCVKCDVQEAVLILEYILLETRISPPGGGGAWGVLHTDGGL